jgi:hypothetical protein
MNMVNSFLFDLCAAIKIIEIMYGFSSARECTIPLEESLLTCKRDDFLAHSPGYVAFLKTLLLIPNPRSHNYKHL